MFDYVGAYSIIIGSACLSSFLSRIWCALLKPASQLARCLFGLFLRLLRRFLCSPAAAAARSLARSLPFPPPDCRERRPVRWLTPTPTFLVPSRTSQNPTPGAFGVTKALSLSHYIHTISIIHSFIHSFSCCCIAKIFRFEQNRVLALRRAGRFRTWPERWE